MELTRSVTLLRSASSEPSTHHLQYARLTAHTLKLCFTRAQQ